MDTILYHTARGLIALAQALPLSWVARIGGFLGGFAYYVDADHRRVAVDNLTRCFDHQLTRSQIRQLARENFRRIGENFICAIKTASMTHEQLDPYLEYADPDEVLSPPPGAPLRRIVAAIGHFGNFELYARLTRHAPARKLATTYRALRQPVLSQVLQSLREKSGCAFFERRFEANALKQFMHEPGAVLGLLADQHAGKNGLRLPFLGHDCSTSAAPAIFALRYDCALHTGICYRVGIARWRIEAGQEIPTRCDGKARPIDEIMLDVNRAFEAAVRRDPANWFWVHKRWKSAALARESSQVVAETQGS
jgi:KDO2-lipid IV(A) lauroyltransferase